MSAFDIHKGPTTGLVELRSKTDVAVFLKRMIDYYSFNVAKYADLLGDLMRSESKKQQSPPKQKSKKAQQRTFSKEGFTILTEESSPGALELITLKIHDELKEKLAQVEGARKRFDSLNELPENAAYVLYLREGLPSVLIVKTHAQAGAPFSFNVDFKVEKWVLSTPVPRLQSK